MISVKMYDALKGVEKTIRHIESVAIYDGQMHCHDKQGTEWVLTSNDLEHYCLYITDDRENK